MKLKKDATGMILLTDDDGNTKNCPFTSQFFQDNYKRTGFAHNQCGNTCALFRIRKKFNTPDLPELKHQFEAAQMCGTEGYFPAELLPENSDGNKSKIHSIN